MKREFIGLSISAIALFTSFETNAQTCQAPQPAGICNRACWTARAPTCTITYMSAPNRAIIHHTAVAGHWNTTGLETSKPSLRSIQNYHIDNNGWCDVGYNFLLDKFGNIFEARYNSISSNTRGIINNSCATESYQFTIMGYMHTPYNNDPDANLRGRLYDVIAWKMPSG